MFEKFSYSDVDSAGQGGEYTVQAGFGWTNGVVLWVASNYGKVLAAPNCPPLLIQAGGNSGGSNGANSTSPGGNSNTSFASHAVQPATLFGLSFVLLVHIIVIFS